MKAIPCRTAGCPGATLLPGTAALTSQGDPLVVGVPSRWPLVYTCARCGRGRGRASYKGGQQQLTARDWGKIPELSLEQLRAIGLLEPALRDWITQGLPEEHAEQLFGAGLAGPGSVAPRENT